MGVSDDEPVTRREFNAFKELAKERHKSSTRGHKSLTRALRQVDKQHDTDMQAVRQEHATDMANLATQREKDQTAQRKQRETDLAEAKRRGEWTWSTKLAVGTLAIAVAGFYLQYIARR